MTMRRAVSTACAALLACLLAAGAGCVNFDAEITIDRDGTGRMLLTYGMAPETIARMESAVKLAADLERASAPPGAPARPVAPPRIPFLFQEEAIRGRMRDYERSGVTLEKVRVEERGGWKFATLRVSFKTLEGLFRTDFFSDYAVSLTRTAAGNYDLVARLPQPAAGAAKPGARSKQEADSLHPFASGLKVKVTVLPPRPVLSSTATSKEDMAATWTFDYQRDPGALDALNETAFRVMFSGRGLAIPEFRTAPPEPAAAPGSGAG